MMVAKTNKYPGGYFGNPLERAGEYEGSDSSGNIDTEITASEDSSAPTRKCISLNSKSRDAYGVPMQVLPLSNMLPSERRDLKHRLRMELEQIRVLKKKLEFQRINGVTASTSSDILSCSNGQNGPHFENIRKPSAPTAAKGKKATPAGGKVGWNRSSSGRFEPENQNSASTANAVLMKQCETLLKRLMSHQYGWVFNTPVDVVKLNIPDYLNVIKHPMDLGTIKSKVTSGCYSSPSEFVADVRLTFTNAMTYNPPKNDVHVMADTLSKFFEVRWKTIEKKIPKSESQPLLEKSGPRENVEVDKSVPPSKKRKVTSTQPEVIPEPAKRVMTVEEKHNLGRELESLLAEMPLNIIDFLKENSSNGKDSGEDEIEIDIDDLSDETLFTLRKLLDDYLLEKQKSTSRAEPCEIELLNESGLSNSSTQPCKENNPADEDVDIGGNEPPVSSYPPVEIEKDSGHFSKIEKDTGHRINNCISPRNSSDSDSNGSYENESHVAKASSLVNAPKVQETLGTRAQLDEKTSADPLDRNQSDSVLDQVEQASQQKPASDESNFREDGDSAPSDRQVSPDKQYRAAVLKNRFADTILRAREKTLTQGEKGDPEKLRREREELELQRKKEKARLQAEAKAAEDARRRAEEEAAAEAKRKRELEREAARQTLLQIEKTVEINENSRFLEDLEMLRTEQLPSSVDEKSPDHSLDGFGSFKFGGSNPLEQLGLFMKVDEEEEEGEPPSLLPSAVNDMEEGEID